MGKNIKRKKMEIGESKEEGMKVGIDVRLDRKKKIKERKNITKKEG